jgi:hypothetical protein
VPASVFFCETALVPVLIVMPRFASALWSALRGVGVGGRDDAVQQLDDRHLAAERRVDVGELEPDRRAAERHEALGHLGDEQRAGRVDDAVAVELEAGQLDRARAGRDDELLRGDLAVADPSVWRRRSAPRPRSGRPCCP